MAVAQARLRSDLCDRKQEPRIEITKVFTGPTSSGMGHHLSAQTLKRDLSPMIEDR
jgi:hypothetical protein